jgi:UDP-2-acetamido-3-amino-2,3-dideoxy-glucuronate N-acetyltransferase
MLKMKVDLMTKSIALLGCGGWGKNLGRSLFEIGVLRAIVDPAPQTAELAEKFHCEHHVSNERVLADQQITAVVIATPAPTHVRVATAAILAGKDVFIEKPIALDVAEATTLSALARQHGRILMVGHLLQYHSGFLALKDIAKSGRLGRIRQLSSSRLNLGVIRSEENVLWSFAPHDVSMILSLAGKKPDRVSAVGTTILQEGIEDIITVHMQFAGGLKADIRLSWLHPQKEQQMIVVGDEGMAVFADTKPWAEKLKIHVNKVAWTDNRPKAQAGPVEAVDVSESEPLKDEMRHFIDCVQTRKEPRTNAEEAIAVLAVLRAAQKSLDENGAWIEMREGDAPSPASATHVHPTAVVDKGCEIGDATRIWHFSHILSGSKIGARCVIGQNVMIGPDVTVGNGCKVQNNVAIYKGVTLEDDVFCGPSMVFTNVLTPRAHVERKNEFAPTRIGKGATLGANCTIVCGHDVGEYAMVGAGAVVTKTVPAHALVVGNPARQIGWVSKSGDRLGPDLICPRTGEDYSKMLKAFGA